MAHMNINERREYVKSKVLSAGLAPSEIKAIAAIFGCSYSAITADIAMIKSNGKFTLYPGRSIKDAVLKRDNYTCQYCWRTDQYIIVDHVIPTSMGGVGYDYNLVAACASCNKRKGGKVWVPNNIDILKKINPMWLKKILSMVNQWSG